MIVETARRVIEPRDRPAAARVLAVAIVLAMVATFGWEVIAWRGGRASSDARSVLTSAVALGASVVLCLFIARYPQRIPTLVWPAVAVAQPLATASAVVALGDASAGAQFGLVYAVVFAASQFNSLFAWAVTSLAVAADAWIVFSVLDPGRAAADLLVVGCALPMITAVLQLTNAHHDELRARLDELADTDSLTGLVTRRRLVEAGTRTLAEGRPVGLLVADVDRFKELNDTHGHPVGDLVLSELAEILRGVAHPGEVAARLGGDELALLVHGGERDLALRAAALRDAVARHRWRRADPAPTLSAGWAVGRDGWDFDDLYEAADRAMYTAKAEGRDRVVGATDREGGRHLP